MLKFKEWRFYFVYYTDEFFFLFLLPYLFFFFCRSLLLGDTKVGDWSEWRSWNSVYKWDLPASSWLPWALPNGSSTGSFIPSGFDFVTYWTKLYSLYFILVNFLFLISYMVVDGQVIFLQPAPLHPHIYSNGHICLGKSLRLAFSSICYSGLHFLFMF